MIGGVEMHVAIGAGGGTWSASPEGASSMATPPLCVAPRAQPSFDMPFASAEPATTHQPGAGSGVLAAPPVWRALSPRLLGIACAVIALTVLFHATASDLARQWWTDPEAGHGLLLAPLASWFAWRRGLEASGTPRAAAGVTLLFVAGAMRVCGELAAELYVARLGMIVALAGLVVYFAGWRQLRAWWLPALLLLLAIPLPAVVVGSLSLPLQLQASEFGATLLRARYVPVHLSGNIIQLPGQSLFVSEACSGLRSLTALVSLGVIVGALLLRQPAARAFIVLAALPIAVTVNGLRIFFTGFLVHHVSPSAGQGFMHMSEGWLMFGTALGLLALLAITLQRVERRWDRRAR